MKSQNIEVADAKGSHPKNNLNSQKSKQKAVLRLNLNLVEYRLRIVKYCETAILHRHGAIIVISWIVNDNAELILALKGT